MGECRNTLVRQEKYLMCRYIDAHKRGNEKKKKDIMKHFGRNVRQRVDAR